MAGLTNGCGVIVRSHIRHSIVHSAATDRVTYLFELPGVDRPTFRVNKARRTWRLTGNKSIPLIDCSTEEARWVSGITTGPVECSGSLPTEVIINTATSTSLPNGLFQVEFDAYPVHGSEGEEEEVVAVRDRL